MAKTENILVLGGSFAGLSVAHYLLRHTIPAVTKADPSKSYKVILISPSKYFFWKIGAPRALISEKLIPLENSFIPIIDGFKSYPASSFEFVQGEVTNLNDKARNVEIKLTAGSSQATNSTLAYHALVIATGGISESPLWSYHGTDEDTRKALKEMHAALPRATSIIVVGGGPAGTETAGELGSEFGGSKEITLLSGSTRLLDRLRPSIGAKAEQFLNNMDVKVRHDVRVSSVSELSNGETKLELSDGTSLTCSIYIEAKGFTPNTSYAPTHLLSSRKAIETDPKTLRVPSAGPLVYAVGSVASYSTGGVLDVYDSIPTLMSTLEVDLSGGKSGAERPFVQATKEMQLVPVGRSKGVGAIMGWWAPSFAVWLIKGRNFMYPMAKDTVVGSKYTKKV
ncbi:MAG: hypothetical protein M1827_001129 [Pycnora praestabilis]|nr:MAG: hypothetical protein M1827_001129 [Pycnora praestabilis]